MFSPEKRDRVVKNGTILAPQALTLLRKMLLMMSGSITKSHCVQGLVFTFVLALGIYAVEVGKNLHDRNRNLANEQMLPRIAAQIETSITHTLAAAHTLAQEVKRSNGSFAYFDSYAAKMKSSFPAVTSYQLAPLGKITEKYPAIDNHISIGTNVWTHWRSALAIESAIERQELVVTHPFTTADFKLAINAWNPVYLTQRGRNHLWGFTSITIMLEDVLADTDFAVLTAQDSSYQVVWQHENSGAEKVLSIAGSLTEQDWKTEGYISTDINMPGDSWTLRIATCTTIKQWQLLLGYLLSFLVAWLAAAYFRSAEAVRNRLSQLVARKTRELNHIAYHDSLTGLPNHRHFFKLLDSDLALNAMEQKSTTVVLVDLDLFSEVNDAFGQHGGDSLLIETAARIARTLPDLSTVARWGDDEFIVLLNNCTTAQAESLVAHISRSLNMPCLINGSTVSVSSCIGVATANSDNTCSNDLLSWVEQALNNAKAKGKNETCWYTEDMRHKCKRRLALLSDMKSGLARNEFELFFQPIVAGSTGKADKAECLLRWHHPVLDNVSPFEFIPLAEETGFIRELGDWVFTEAVKQVRVWRTQYNSDFCVSVNVSPVQLNLPGTVKKWLQLLQRYDVPAEAILIEITEGILLDQNTAAYAQIEELRVAGFSLALDDFGTGYSSMSYLKVFDIDYIKIDRSFVSNLAESRDDMILCDAIIAIAEKMNIRVVAEGVETLQQHQLLTAAGSDYSQGYYFSKPVSATEFEQKFLQPQEMVA